MSLPPSPTPLHVPLIQVTVRFSFLRPPVSDRRSAGGRCVSGPWNCTNLLCIRVALAQWFSNGRPGNRIGLGALLPAVSCEHVSLPRSRL